MRHLTLCLLASAVFLAACPPLATSFDPSRFDSAPVARMSAPVTGALDRPVVLDGAASYDPDGDTLVWNWRIEEQPAGSALPSNPFLANGDRNAEVTSFVPDALGRYTVALSVGSGELDSDSVYAIISVSPDGTLPQADAGPDRVSLEQDELCLDGSGSWDPLGVALSHSWSLAGRPEGSQLTTADLTGADVATACFTPDAPGLFTLGLAVTAGQRESAPDYVDVTVQSTNQPPIAAGQALSSSSCSFLTLDGSASSDPDGDALAYRWSVLLTPAGSSLPLGEAGFDDAALASPTLYADAAGSYLVELSVFDGESWSAPDLIEVETTPKPVNTPPRVVHQGDVYFADTPLPCTGSCPPVQVVLDASGSFDPDGDPIDLSWQVVSGDAVLDVQEGPLTELTIAGLPGSCVTGSPSDRMVTVRVDATDCSGETDSGQMIVLYECGLGL